MQKTNLIIVITLNRRIAESPITQFFISEANITRPSHGIFVVIVPHITH